MSATVLHIIPVLRLTYSAFLVQAGGGVLTSNTGKTPSDLRLVQTGLHVCESHAASLDRSIRLTAACFNRYGWHWCSAILYSLLLRCRYYVPTHYEPYSTLSNPVLLMEGTSVFLVRRSYTHLGKSRPLLHDNFRKLTLAVRYVLVSRKSSLLYSSVLI
jgi:hypothetical protein